MNGGIIIFGASGGIGSEVSRKFAAIGNSLLLVGRNEERLSAVARETDSQMVVADAFADGALKDIFKKAKTEFSKIDGVVNCLGSILLKPIHRTSDEEWQETINLNLTSAFLITRSATKAMMKNGGSIVLISSAAARVGLANHAAIAAAKAGVEGLARSVAATYAARNIRVNVVSPGLVETPLSADITASERQRKASEALHPLGRLGKPAEIASAVVWLMQSEQSWLTGQVIGVDGGLSALRNRPVTA